jgi:hypothetical protein
MDSNCCLLASRTAEKAVAHGCAACERQRSIRHRAPIESTDGFLTAGDAHVLVAAATLFASAAPFGCGHQKGRPSVPTAKSAWNAKVG